MSKFTFMYIMIAAALIYLLTQYIKQKSESFDVINKVREGSLLNEYEQKIWQQYRNHLNQLNIIDSKSQINEMENRKNNSQNIMLATGILSTGSIVALSIFLPPLAPIAGTLITVAGNNIAKNQISK